MCKKIPRSDLIEEIERLADEIGRTPKCTEMKDKGKYSLIPYRNEFGKWSDAIRESGREPIVNRNKQVDKEDIFEEIKRLSVEHHNGNKPSISSLKEYSDYTRVDIKKHFKNWGEAIEKMGFEIKNKEINKDNIIYEELHGVKDTVGRPPRKVDLDKHSSISSSYVQSQYDSWIDALINNDIEPDEYQRGEINKKKFIEDFIDIAEGREKTPTIDDYNEAGEYNDSTIRKRFGSWIDFVEECGYEAAGRPQGKDHYMWEGGWGGYYGLSWHDGKSECLQRDQFRCQVCFKSQNRIGRKPDVHHIAPAKEWDIEEEHEQMNDLSNLVSLCPECHGKLEGEFADCSPNDFIEKSRQVRGIL